jgi:DNA-binding beta-propeller fold protein YncE
MIRPACTTPFIALVFVTGAALAADGTLLVANRAGGSVSLIDLPTETEIARLPIGPVIPHEIAASPDGRWAVTGEYGGGNNPGRHLVVIDVAAAEIVARIDLGPNSRPHSIAFLPDSRRVLATMEQSAPGRPADGTVTWSDLRRTAAGPTSRRGAAKERCR